MGEIFIRPMADEVVESNGERLTASITGETAIEHWHRYLLARELARGLDVLDVASGEGYGTALMAQTARKVTGVEISAETVAHARASYAASNLDYVHGDARRIPLPDDSVDLVVSFETLEHFREHDQFLAEVKRVLRPDGALLLSTPARDTYSPAGLPPNPHHVLELTPTEFSTLLGRYFAHISAQGQRVLLGSALMAQENGAAVPQLTFERRGAEHFETSTGMARARFIVALASDEARHRLPTSVYIDSDRLGYTDGPALEALPGQHAETERMRLDLLAKIAGLRQDRDADAQRFRQDRDADAQRLREDREADAQRLRHAEEALEKVTRRSKSLEESCLRAEEAVRAYRDQVGSQEGVAEALAAMRASTSWKISAPIRILGRMLRRS